MPLGALQTATDLRDVRLRTTVARGENSLRFGAIADRLDRFLSKPSIPVSKTARIALLRGHISLVVSNCSWAQVGRAHALRVVALVQQYFASWNFANQLLVNEAVSHNSPAICSAASDIYESISPRGSLTSPKPARLGFVDSRVKRHARKNRSVQVKLSASSFAHVVRLAQVPAEGTTAAKQAFRLFSPHNAIMPQV